MENFENSGNLVSTMQVKDDSKTKPKGSVGKNIDPATNRFIFKRTPAGERVRTLVEMKGDEIIRQGVDAAYNYLNGRKAGINQNIDNPLILTRHNGSLLTAILPFIIGVILTLFLVADKVPGGFSGLFK